MSFDVFISYSSKDKTTADAACAALEATQVRCWIAPRDIAPGADWGASIIEALDRCRVMVLIFSASANDSAQIRNEVVHAVQRGVPVIPVRIEDIQPAKSLAYFMGAVHWLDALSPPLETHLKRLAESIRAMLQPIPGDQPPTALSSAPETARSAPPAASAPDMAPAAPATAGGMGRVPPRAAAPRRRNVALATLAIGALLIAGASALYLGPGWDGWFAAAPTPQLAGNMAPPAPAPAPTPAAPPFSDLLLARLTLAMPSLTAQSQQQRVKDYVQAKEHKAQAASLQPAGAWRATVRSSPQVAEDSALENCQLFFGQPCVLIAVNDRVSPVPDNGVWPRRDMPRVRYAGNFDPNQIPGMAHLRQRSDIIGYAAAPGPKAVALHPTAGVVVVTGADSQRAAEEKALETCNRDPKKPAHEGQCFLYAVGNQVVLPQRLQKPMT